MRIICINPMIHKTITIREDQAKWIRKHHLNLSRFVQDKLDEEINNENKKMDS